MLVRLRFYFAILLLASPFWNVEASVQRPAGLDMDSLLSRIDSPDSLSVSDCLDIFFKHAREMLITGTPVSNLDSAIVAALGRDNDLALLHIERFLVQTSDPQERAFAFYVRLMMFANKSEIAEQAEDTLEMRQTAQLGLESADSLAISCQKDPYLYLLRAYLNGLLNNKAGQDDNFRELLKLYPDSSQLAIIAVEYYYETDQYQRADSLLARISALGNLDTDGWYRWATVKMMLEQYLECIDACDRVLANDLTRSDAKALKGGALYELRRYDEVVPLLTEVVRIDSTDEWSWFRLGYSQRMLKQTDEMIHSMRTVLRLGYKWPDCYYNLACGAEAFGDYETAVLLADSAVMLDTTNSDYYWLLAHEQNRAGKLEASVQTYAIAKKLAPSNAQLWWESSQPLWKLNRLDDMWAAVDSTLKYDPNHERALRFLGNHLIQTGEHKRALSCFEKLTKIHPNFAEYWEKQSVLQYLTGQYEESLKSCDVALSLSPEQSSLQEQKKEILLKLGRRE